MDSVIRANGHANQASFYQSLLNPNNDGTATKRFTVQQALSKWYVLLNNQNISRSKEMLLFTDLTGEKLVQSFQTDVELVPSLLMEEMIGSSMIFDKGQYTRLVQVLLINLSDLLYDKGGEEFQPVCEQIENTIQFIQDFFYQYADPDCKISKNCLRGFLDCFSLKLEYWQLKLQPDSVIIALKECLSDKFSALENDLTYRKLNYLKNLLSRIESATTVLTEEFIREALIYNNFNSECFIDYEKNLIKSKISGVTSFAEIITCLQNEQTKIGSLRTKANACFDNQQPSVKKQLTDFIAEEIKQAEVKNSKAADKDLLIDVESKIQTSLSVAKLAVLIRLLVVDKIIINKSVAPMLRTVTKLFTTLQKDEISFGSLETKYHAPDKNTASMMKEMLQKWAAIAGKL